MAYEMVMPYHLHMPSYFLETFTEYPYGCGRHSNASLTCFANAFYIVIGKPFDFGFEQCFFYVLELGLTDNNFNFFIVVFVFCI